MKLTFRWYGEKDCIPLNYIKQIQGMTGVVTAVYDVPVGDVWELSKLERLKSLCNNAGLEMEVIESIPVHEDIKLGKPTRDKLIANYAQNIINCGKVGVKCVCYNFMPVFDWFRTNLYYKHADGSTSLSYSEADFNKLDKHNLRLPGWDESYSPEQLNGLLKEYEGMTHEKLFENLVYFLNGIMPACNEAGVNMAHGIFRRRAFQRFAENGGEICKAHIFRSSSSVEVRKRYRFLRKRASDCRWQRGYLFDSPRSRRKRI